MFGENDPNSVFFSIKELIRIRKNPLVFIIFEDLIAICFSKFDVLFPSISFSILKYEMIFRSYEFDHQSRMRDKDKRDDDVDGGSKKRIGLHH